MTTPNHLYYGDNLVILRERIPDHSVDLIYLDPPFNSNQAYNIIFEDGDLEDAAQIRAFDDTWHWSQQAEDQFAEIVAGGAPPKVAEAITAMRHLLGTTDLFAYLVMMTPRLVELHRVLKPTGSLYLHCDPTASHYLKVMLDSIFGPTHFQNEIIWAYEVGGRGKKRWARKHDVILFYSKTDKFQFHWKRVAVPRKPGSHMKVGVDDDGREYQEKTDAKSGKTYRYYLDKGAIPPDWWIGPQQLNRSDAERLGYPTQKPVALLERIVLASSNEGDVVLDPFCGCGPTVDAAHKLQRRWIGIDITYLAVDLIRKRMRHTYGDDIEDTYTIHGVPADLGGARALAAENPFDFERWAVSLIDAQPSEKQVGDKGIDGRVRFYSDKDRIGQVLVSVKGGKSLNPGMVRDLRGTVERDGTEMGILITLAEPTRGMVEEANKSGSFESPLTGQTYPRIQIVTVADLLAGVKPNMPTAILPYLKAKPHNPDQLSFE